MIILLVGNSELYATSRSCWVTTAKAGRLNNISTFFILNLSALTLLSGGALGIGSSNTLGGIVVDSNLSDDGHIVADDLVISTLPHRHLSRVLFLHQGALFPSLQLAVLIASPHFLTSSVQHPLGVTMFLCYIPTHRNLVVLIQSLESILLTLLGGEVKGLHTIIVEVSSELI